MSRIGKLPISIPAGVEVKVEGTEIILTTKNDTKQANADHGLYRSLVANMVKGVSEGYQKTLIINGVGYKAAAKGKVLELALGFSHPINYELPDGVEVSVEKNIITIKGSDKQVVGQFAANVRAVREPEPYKGKGIRYKDEVVRRKEGKKASK